MAATAVVALLTAMLQHVVLPDPTEQSPAFLLGWALAAFVSLSMIGIEMRARSQRHHSGLADAMIHQAVEQFLPAGIAGVLAAIGIVVIRVRPVPLEPRVTEAERQAHRAFVATLGEKAIWKDYLPVEATAA